MAQGVNDGQRIGNEIAVKSIEVRLRITIPSATIAGTSFRVTGMSIYDTMQFIKPDVSTLCIGQAASMGAFLLCAGAKGKRFALPNSRVMIHQPLGGFQGQASDIAIHAKEILSIRDRLNRIMAEHTGQPLDRIEKDTDRDNFLSSQEAAEYGLIDKVLTRRDAA